MTVIGKMVNIMESGNFCGRIRVIIKENGGTIERTDWESSWVRMEQYTKENGRKESITVEVSLKYLVERFLQAISTMGNFLVETILT